jgi:hypothetical protein
MKLFNKSGFLQATGVMLYIGLVGLFINNAETLVGNLNLPLGPILMLLLLSASVLICAVLVLYKPYILFTKDKKKEALKTVISTAAWLFVFLVIFIVSIITFK